MLNQKILKLTGKRFGRLVVLERVENNQRGSTVWRCRCDCSKIKNVIGTNLTNKLTTSCGCFKKETLSKRYSSKLKGRRFGRLKVLERAGSTEGDRSLWKCKCDCGNVKIVRGKELSNGHTKSCGCFREETLENNAKKKALKIKGVKFNKLTAIRRVGVNNDGRVVWECKCDCGNIVPVPACSLVSGNTKSCGCQIKDTVAGKLADKYIGQKFGKLTVLRRLGSDDNDKSLWECKCDCGNTKSVKGYYLLCGDTKSCGCIISNGENAIENILASNKILYDKQKKFPDCKNKNPLPFDFGIWVKGRMALIEYQGVHHYQLVNFNGHKTTKQELEETQRRDKIKKQYCLDNSIPFLEVPYWEQNIEQAVCAFVKRL